MSDSRGPLFGKRILVTRAAAEADETAELVRARGAIPVVVPMITIGAPKDWDFAVAAMHRLAASDWVVFTSQAGVVATARALREAGLDVRAFGAVKIAAIGAATATALTDTLHVGADLVPTTARGEGLAKALLDAIGTNANKVTLLRAEVARDVLPDGLRAAGHDVQIVPMYATRGPDPADIAELATELARGAIDVVTVTSGSTVDNLCDALGAHAAELLGEAFVASLGPVTTEVCARRGVRVDLTATRPSVAVLIEEVETAFEATNHG